ncbi:MAG: glucose-1-phosphate adenylyltransferase, partial [Gemmataceae bacterium]
MLRDVLTVVLAGGRGTRLEPLTRDRAKPAVPFGGSYRIIDFTLSNCVNSGLRRVQVLTQFKSQSLDRHIRRGWNFLSPELGEAVEVLPPQQRIDENWYKGTADAIYQNIYLLERERPQHVLILGGDHVYKMDYGEMLRRHVETGAVLTVGCIETPREEATRFGVMRVDADMRIRAFRETPADPDPVPGKPDRALASMGFYIFDTEALVKALIADARADTARDFGKNIIPDLVAAEAPVYAHPFHEPSAPDRSYWRDIGTLDSFYDANMDLIQSDPPFDMYGDDWPIRTYYQPLPPARVVNAGGHTARIENVLLSPGVQIRGAVVRNSVLS